MTLPYNASKSQYSKRHWPKPVPFYVVCNNYAAGISSETGAQVAMLLVVSHADMADSY